MAPTAFTGIRGLQETGSGLLTSYQQDALAGIGFPSLVGLISSDNKAATTGVASAVLYTTVQSGVFAVVSAVRAYSLSGTNGTLTPQVIYQADDSTPSLIITAGSAISVSQAGLPTFSTGIVVLRVTTTTSIYGSAVLTGGGTPSYTYTQACFRLS